MRGSDHIARCRRYARAAAGKEGRKRHKKRHRDGDESGNGEMLAKYANDVANLVDNANVAGIARNHYKYEMPCSRQRAASARSLPRPLGRPNQRLMATMAREVPVRPFSPCVARSIVKKLGAARAY